jgi:hypothetical protein
MANKGTEMNFEMIAREQTLESIGRRGAGSVDFKVKGFWSSSIITVYIQRDSYETVRWNAKISPSSGGRDTKEVESDAEAYQYFAEALAAAVDLARQYDQASDQLEEFYQLQRIDDRAEYSAYLAAEAAKVEADAPLGEEKAKRLIARMVSGEVQLLTVFARGQDAPRPLNCTIRAKAKLYFCGGIIAKAEAIRMLANSSARTHVAH